MVWNHIIVNELERFSIFVWSIPLSFITLPWQMFPESDTFSYPDIANETHEWAMIKYMTACIVQATIPLLETTFVFVLNANWIDKLIWCQKRPSQSLWHLLSSLTHSDCKSVSLTCLRRKEIKISYFVKQSNEDFYNMFIFLKKMFATHIYQINKNKMTFTVKTISLSHVLQIMQYVMSSVR